MELSKNVMSSFLGVSQEEHEKQAQEPSRIGYYKRCLESGIILPHISFTHGGKKEGCWFLDKDVKVYLPLEELFSSSKYSDRYVFLDQLNREYAVKVIDVNEEDKLVTVSVTRAQEEARPDVLKEIDQALKDGKHPRVKAIVKFLTTDALSGISRTAYLDIMGLDITGRMKNKDYADCFIPDLRPVLKIGDIIDVAVTSKDTETYRGRVTYNCSRAEVVPSAWDHINDLIKVDQMVKVECLTPRGVNFVGRILDVDDVTCSCVYPKDVLIETGGIYTGFVTRIDPEKHKLFVEIGKNR